MKIAMTSVLVDDPVKAHAFYTEVLGFVSKDFQPEAMLAVVASPEDPGGTALLLEPRGDEFGREYQQKAYEKGLPFIIFGAEDVAATRADLESKGVLFRDDLARPDWGLENIFEDTCGNYIMLMKS